VPPPPLTIFYFVPTTHSIVVGGLFRDRPCPLDEVPANSRVHTLRSASPFTLLRYIALPDTSRALGRDSAPILYFLLAGFGLSHPSILIG